MKPEQLQVVAVIIRESDVVAVLPNGLGMMLTSSLYCSFTAKSGSVRLMYIYLHYPSASRTTSSVVLVVSHSSDSTIMNDQHSLRCV